MHQIQGDSNITNVMSHVQIIFQKENLTLVEYVFVLHLMVQSTERLATFLRSLKYARYLAEPTHLR